MSERLTISFGMVLAAGAFVFMSLCMRDCMQSQDRAGVQRYCVERGNPPTDCAKLGVFQK